MLGSLKQRAFTSQRLTAASERYRAAQRFITALDEAEAALEALRLADDRFYTAEHKALQSSANELRQSRERMYSFHVAAEVVREAPRLARLLEVRGGGVSVMPFAEFIAHTSALDTPPGAQGQEQNQ